MITISVYENSDFPSNLREDEYVLVDDKRLLASEVKRGMKIACPIKELPGTYPIGSKAYALQMWYQLIRANIFGSIYRVNRDVWWIRPVYDAFDFYWIKPYYVNAEVVEVVKREGEPTRKGPRIDGLIGVL